LLLNDKHTFCKLIRHQLLLIYCLLTCITVNGQKSKNYTIHFADTTTAGESFLLYNNIEIKNLSADSLQLEFVFLSSDDWSLVSPPQILAVIPGNQDLSIPLTLKKRSNTSSTWQRINFTVGSSTGNSTDGYFFNIYSDPLSKFSVTNIYNGLLLTDPRDLRINFILKNNGNIDGQYHVSFQNDKLNLDHEMVITLKPGKDSVVKYTYHLSNTIWKELGNETIRLVVADSFFTRPKIKVKQRFIRNVSNNTSAAKMFSDHFDIFRSDSVFSMHKTDYTDVNLGFETGFIGSSKRVSYYTALRLSYDITKKSKFSFYYRSRQFGIYNTIDRDVFTIGLKTAHWNIKAGKISNSQFFLTYGNGLEIGYSWKKNNTITVFGVKHTPGFHTTNDNAGILLKYNIGKVIINHDLLYNTDSASHIRSTIINTDLQWRIKNIDLDINGGLGTESVSAQNKDNKTLAAAFGGYRIVYKLKSFSLNSQYKAFGKDFPGLYAGAKTENYDISYQAKKISAKMYYQVNISNNSYFKDTLYNTDFTTFNTSKYGLKFSLVRKRSFLTIGYGWLRQSGQQAYSFTPRYQFVEMLYNLRGKKYFSLGFSTSNGYANLKENKAGAVYFSQSSLNISFKNIGVNIGYTSIPVVDTVKKAVYNNTVYGGPYLAANFGKNFSIGIQYSLSKTLYDNSVNSFAGINMAYNNEKAQTNILVNISSPLKKANEKSIDPFKNGYINISLVKNFNLPFIFKKKYHSLETVFVEDQNSNGMADLNENRIPQVRFAINNLHFISNSNGIANYRHIDTGNYTIDMSGARLQGLIPKDGYVQVIRSDKSGISTILFSKSSIISGHIEILQDSTAIDQFLVNNIKVVAVDEQGRKYATTTDLAGDYFFNLPSGVYRVSLNQDAFNQNYRPDKINAEADLTKTEKAVVNFVIKQKSRSVNMLDVNQGKEIDIKSVKPKADDGKPKAAKPKH
jgi:hypothetical protein